jgi:transposase
MAYGQAMRQRVLKAYDSGQRTREIAQRFDVSESWCRRVKQFRHEPPRKIGGGHFKLDGAGRVALADFVLQKPDSTLEELRTRIAEDLGISISVGALWNTLRRMNLPLKKSH